MKDVSSSLPEEQVIQTYRATIRPLYAYIARRVGGDAGLAEDIVHDTWMRALDAWPRRGMPDAPLAWLMRVARNALISHFRRVQPEFVDPGTLDLGAANFIPDTPDTAAVVGWGMARLRRGHADVLEAFYFDGKSTRQIAADWSLSERAVEGRLHRARAVLKKKLQRIIDPAVARAGRGGTEHA